MKLRNKRCDGCAFTEGTKANLHDITRIKAELCSEISEVFYCHFNSKDGETLPKGQEFVCEGWREKTWALDKQGFYAKQPEWKKEYKKQLLFVIEAFQDKPDATDQEISEAIFKAFEQAKTLEK